MQNLCLANYTCCGVLYVLHCYSNSYFVLYCLPLRCHDIISLRETFLAIVIAEQLTFERLCMYVSLYSLNFDWMLLTNHHREMIVMVAMGTCIKNFVLSVKNKWTLRLTQTTCLTCVRYVIPNKLILHCYHVVMAGCVATVLNTSSSHKGSHAPTVTLLLNILQEFICRVLHYTLFQQLTQVNISTRAIVTYFAVIIVYTGWYLSTSKIISWQGQESNWFNW